MGKEKSNDVDKELTQKYCYRFGKIAVEKGFITEDRLKDAIIEQLEDNLNDRAHRMLGMILFEKGWMTTKQIDEVLKELFERRKEQESQ